MKITKVRYGIRDAGADFVATEPAEIKDNTKNKIIEISLKAGSKKYYYNHIDGKKFDKILPAQDEMDLLILDNKYNISGNYPFQSPTEDDPNKTITSAEYNFTAFLKKSENFFTGAIGVEYKGYMQGQILDNTGSVDSPKIVKDDILPGSFTFKITQASDKFGLKAAFKFDNPIPKATFDISDAYYDATIKIKPLFTKITEKDFQLLKLEIEPATQDELLDNLVNSESAILPYRYDENGNEVALENATAKSVFERHLIYYKVPQAFAFIIPEGDTIASQIGGSFAVFLSVNDSAHQLSEFLHIIFASNERILPN